MKTIIAGTDFTESSINACRYAALLAQKLNCKLVLFNLFKAPLIHSNMGLYGISFYIERQESDQNTSALAEDLHKSFPKVKIDTFLGYGSFTTELKKFIKAHQIEAVVMGLDAKNKISKFVFGSHGIKLTGKISAPVIIVPENYMEHHVSQFLLAVDNQEKLYKTSLSKFEKFITGLKGKLDILHVRTPDEIFPPAIDKIKINGKNRDIIVHRAKNIKNGVRNFCKDKSVDMIVIISKHHSVFYNMFQESNTKKLAFEAEVPVMSIHD